LSTHDVTARLNWFGTFRGRAGFESNGVWIYGTAGLAYGQVSVSGTNALLLFDNNFGFAPPTLMGSFVTPFNYSQLKGGWTAGLGIEGLIGNGPWRWKVEYLHIDLGSINGGIFGAFFPSVQANTTRFTDEILRVGFNYKFDSDGPVIADMAVKAPARPLAPSLGWTGWYAGVNAGYIDSVGRTNTDAAFFFANNFSAGDAGNLANSATNQFNHHFGGFLGGAQAGYNYQFSPTVVAGLEADIQGSTLRRNLAVTSTVTDGDFFSPSWVTTTTVSNRLDYLGTVRGRLGVVPTPNLLLYSTGGLAYGGVRSSTQIAFNNTGGAVPGTTAGSFSDTRFGWTVGGGGEWKFSANWTAKLEYLYYDLGSATYATGGYAVDLSPTTFASSGIVSVATSTTTRFNGNIARVGLNYKFGGGPVVASY
jgi:outer membrane immunogenic protein